MFSNQTFPAWIGVLVLAGMFLMGQEGWAPPFPSRSLPDTGITTCYNAHVAISCPGPGDSFFGQDAQYVIHPMDYVVNGDGTVTDHVTGLMWQRCSAGLSGPDCSVGAAETKNWYDASTYCEGLSLGSHSTWRLPDEYDLLSIQDYGQDDPATDPSAFPGTPGGWYWSSSTVANNSDRAGMVTSGYLTSDWKTAGRFVRCVRGETAFPSSFADNGDGTVTDDVTGRVWQQQDDGVPRNWENALKYCQELVLPPGGHSDWRLPNVKELQSIVDNSVYDPAIDTGVFPGTHSSWYWTSSTPRWAAYRAFCVNFLVQGQIYDNYKADSYRVRCVR